MLARRAGIEPLNRREREENNGVNGRRVEEERKSKLKMFLSFSAELDSNLFSKPLVEKKSKEPHF